MNQTELENSILLRQFHDFYSEVISEKRKIEDSGHSLYPNVPAGKLPADRPFSLGMESGPTSPAPVDANAGAVLEPASQEPQSATAETATAFETDTSRDTAYPVHVKLLSLLKHQAHEARRYGGEYGVTFHREAQYVMAALADEIFLHLGWEGKEAWKTNLLEFRLFDSHVAGDLFFQKLDALLQNRDPAMVEMAAVYLLALSLGFRGKFRDTGDEGQLDFYRNQLFTFMFRRNPDILNESKRLFPETYDYTLKQGGAEKLPYIRRWIGLIIILIILYLIISHGIWKYVIGDLIEMVETIFKEVGIL